MRLQWLAVIVAVCHELPCATDKITQKQIYSWQETVKQKSQMQWQEFIFLSSKTLLTKPSPLTEAKFRQNVTHDTEISSQEMWRPTVTVTTLINQCIQKPIQLCHFHNINVIGSLFITIKCHHTVSHTFCLFIVAFVNPDNCWCVC